MFRRAMSLVIVATLSSPSPAQAREGWLIPPVDAVVTRAFNAPASRWGPGHRGIDFAVPAGTAVRAAAAGTVLFAGSVASVQAVTIRHAGDLRTTYSDLSEISVDEGDVVEQGTWIGRAGESHAGATGLHFGVKIGERYVDPAAHLGPADVASAARLVPVTGSTHVPVEDDHACEERTDLARAKAPPNRNVAVAVAGIGSRTQGGVDAEIYEEGPQHLGYPEERTYFFSYRGTAGARLHAPYSRIDTFGGVRGAALRLRELLARIARRHPGASVDLIAHSQGGIVARTFLASLASAWAPDLPSIDHLVTFSSPHGGAPAARAASDLGARTRSGPLLLDALSGWARAGAPIPDPLSDAVGDLAPGSPLMDELARRDVAWGTQVLSIAVPDDVVVPADRALWGGKLGRVVPPPGGWAHGEVVSSPAARGLAYEFLRDGAEPCPTGWDTWGPLAGRAIGSTETSLPHAYGALERISPVDEALAALDVASRAAPRVVRGIWGLANPFR